MPAILPTSQSPPPKVLVTGGTGYIGPWVIKYLLEDGFRVRAIVRDEKSWKTGALKEFFASYIGIGKGGEAQRGGDDEGRLEFCVVEDFLKDNAFEEAVKGVDAVIHLASPLQGASAAPGGEGNSADIDADREFNSSSTLIALITSIRRTYGVCVDFIRPAREGTLNLLRSATTSPSPVKRIVYTSSTSAISRYPLTSPHTVFTEEDWGIDPEIVQEQGNKASGFVKYRASKTLAERAAWEYYRESNKGTKKEEEEWDLVVLNPPFVLGPNLVPSFPVATGVQWWFDVLTKHNLSDSDPTIAASLKGSCPYVDVRDTARAHVEALKRPEAGGERIIVGGGSVGWVEAIDHVNSLDNLPPLKASITKVGPSFDRSEVKIMSFSNVKSKRVLGMDYREYEKTVRDMLTDLSERGL
ncbi:hypothetical protein MD484_g8861, partial [Candolleomyces efflorescens]